MNFDLIVIGGGSGGIATAIRAAKLGAHVALVERSSLGGTCVNLGCVPKKVMYNASAIADILHQASDYGFSPVTISLDWAQLVKKRNEYIQRLHTHYSARLTQLNITLLQGTGMFVNEHTVEVDGAHYQANHIVIATGGTPTLPQQLPGIEHALTSDGFFALTAQPKKAVIVGSGYIGVELAGILQGLGTETHLLIRGQRLLSHFDAMLGDTLLEIMQQKQLAVHLEHQLESITSTDGLKTIRCTNGFEMSNIDTLIVAIGRSPCTAELNLDSLGVERDSHGLIKVDKFQNTTVKNIYALGDITDAPALTPVAIAAGRKLSDRLFGGNKEACVDYEMISSVVFSHPPIGTVGLTEAQAIANYGKDAIKLYQTRFNPMFDALTDDKTPTIMKLITLGQEEKIIGLHLIGYYADEILQGFGVAIKMGACKKDFDNTIAIHPTSAEELVTMV